MNESVPAPQPSSRVRIAALLLPLVCLSILGAVGALLLKADEPAPAARKAQAARTETKPEKDETPAPENPFPRRFKAPELDGGNGWLNTAGEITLNLGRIVFQQGRTPRHRLETCSQRRSKRQTRTFTRSFSTIQANRRRQTAKRSANPLLRSRIAR